MVAGLREDVAQAMTRRKPPPKWFEVRSNQVILAAAALAALTYFFGGLKSVLDSGPLPLSGRTELTDLHKEVEGHIATLDKTLNDTLEVAKTANAQSQAALSITNDYRLDRLLQQKIQLEDQVAKSPGDSALKAALARTNIDIGKLTALPTK